jgi:hypothetical protein
VGFHVPYNHPSIYLHLLIRLEVGDLTFIAILFYTDEDVDTIVPWIGAEHVYFFFLFISPIQRKRARGAYEMPSIWQMGSRRMGLIQNKESLSFSPSPVNIN